jgi:ubiquinone/menaquinone biosynthesis C-methylase UbiE
MGDNARLHWDDSWTALLACPECGGSLEINKNAELRCESCSQLFPVLSQVPTLLVNQTSAELKTQELYGDIWDNYRKPSRQQGYRAPAASHIELLKLASNSELVQGETGIDAGCGNGGSVIAMANQHPDIRFIGIDLTGSLQLAATRTENISNIRFVQGNLMALPLAKHAFDFIYSFGVLHHTRDPQTAFRSLLERLRPGGRITIFVYKDFTDLPLKKMLLAPVTLARRITTKLPAALLRKFAWCGAPIVFVTLAWPARLLRWLHLDRLAKHIPYGTFPGIRGIAASLEDRFGAPYEHRFSLSDLQAWARSAKLENARIVDCLPWGFSGLLLSGCTPRS